MELIQFPTNNKMLDCVAPWREDTRIGEEQISFPCFSLLLPVTGPALSFFVHGVTLFLPLVFPVLLCSPPPPFRGSDIPSTFWHAGFKESWDRGSELWFHLGALLEGWNKLAFKLLPFLNFSLIVIARAQKGHVQQHVFSIELLLLFS